MNEYQVIGDAKLLEGIQYFQVKQKLLAQAVLAKAAQVSLIIIIQACGLHNQVQDEHTYIAIIIM